MDSTDREAEQLEICKNAGVSPFPTLATLKLGIADNVLQGGSPINGMRVPPHGEISGWYIWAGEELSQEKGFFKPMHISHLHETCPHLSKFLLLPPGWQFLSVPNEDYHDMWFNEWLLQDEK